jgi:hypothetical protein
MSASLPPDASLSQVLSARAMRTPRDRLWIDVAGGAAIVLVAAWAKPAGWVVLASMASCLLCYGVWASAERALRALTFPFPRNVERRWEVVRSVAGLLGIASFVLFLFAGLGVALGRLIS